MRDRVAFTLIELLVVLAIIAVLSGLVLGIGHHASNFGQTVRAKAELAAVSAALESYKRQYGDYPRTNRPDELLQALIGKRGPTGAIVSGRVFIDLANFRSGDALNPFLNSAAEIVDPWDQPYAYAYRSEVPWTNAGYVLYSKGRDGLAAELLLGGAIDELAPANADNICLDQ